MTQDAQKQYWLEQAQAMLPLLNMPEATVSWLSFTHHPVFRVKHQHKHYILRLGTNRSHSPELKVLNQLSAIGLSAPQVLNQIESKVSGTIFNELQGESRSNNTITTDDMRHIGQYLAKLHNTDLDTDGLRRLDWDGLFGDTGVYYPGDDNMQVFTDEQLNIIVRVTEKVRVSMDVLLGDTGLIHGDFLLKNLLFDGNTLHALDWEYAGWGYYLYDLTPVLWQLKPSSRYTELEAALWDSYTKNRPDAMPYLNHLETMIAGRQVASMRWVAANQDNPYVQGKVVQILRQRTDELAQFLETGVLIRQ